MKEDVLKALNDYMNSLQPVTVRGRRLDNTVTFNETQRTLSRLTTLLREQPDNPEICDLLKDVMDGNFLFYDKYKGSPEEALKESRGNWSIEQAKKTTETIYDYREKIDCGQQ